MADEIYYDKIRKMYTNTPPQRPGAGEGLSPSAMKALEEKAEADARKKADAAYKRSLRTTEEAPATGATSKYAKGGSVKGWGKARGGRSAKIC